MTTIRDKVIFDAKVSDRKILLIPIETIAATPYNPSARTALGAQLRRLAKSVEKYGVIQPLVITADRDLVDGNRRLAAAKMSGHEFVECIILPASVDKDEAFCDVNTTAEKIGGRGWLEACRHGFRKPPPEKLAQYQEIYKLVGSYGVDMLIEKKLGLNILELCKSAKATGVALRLDQIIMSVAAGKLTNKINAEIRSDKTPKEKAEAITVILGATT